MRIKGCVTVNVCGVLVEKSEHKNDGQTYTRLRGKGWIGIGVFQSDSRTRLFG